MPYSRDEETNGTVWSDTPISNALDMVLSHGLGASMDMGHDESHAFEIGVYMAASAIARNPKLAKEITDISLVEGSGSEAAVEAQYNIERALEIARTIVAEDTAHGITNDVVKEAREIAKDTNNPYQGIFVPRGNTNN